MAAGETLRSACKPYSVGDVHLSRQPVTRLLMRSTRGSTAPSQRWHPKMLFPCLTLHRKGVAWPLALLPAPVVSYTAFSPWHACACGMFLWPDPEACASPGVTWLPALWCTDFPHRREQQRAHPTDL